MTLLDKLKEIKMNELVLPAAGLISAALLTYGAREASGFLSHYINNNLTVGSIVAASEFVVGSALLKHPTDYTVKNVYGIDKKFSIIHPIASFRAIVGSDNQEDLSFWHPINSFKSLLKSDNRVKRDLAIFSLATILLSGCLYVARPIIYNSNVEKGYEKKKASIMVDAPINFGKAVFFNSLGLYLLHRSRRHNHTEIYRHSLKEGF